MEMGRDRTGTAVARMDCGRVHSPLAHLRGCRPRQLAGTPRLSYFWDCTWLLASAVREAAWPRFVYQGLSGYVVPRHVHAAHCCLWTCGPHPCRKEVRAASRARVGRREMLGTVCATFSHAHTPLMPWPIGEHPFCFRPDRSPLRTHERFCWPWSRAS
jgi:hypothetical protein